MNSILHHLCAPYKIPSIIYLRYNTKIIYTSIHYLLYRYLFSIFSQPKSSSYLLIKAIKQPKTSYN
jgi:hypothetical protein